MFRRLLCGAALVCAAVCAWPGGWKPAWLNGLVPSLSPFNALLTLAAGAGGLFLLGAVAVAAACAVWPRAFCRWLCPAGTCQQTSIFLTRRHEGTKVFLTGLARFFPFALFAPLRLKKDAPAVKNKPPFYPGAWLVFIGTGAALMGYPLFGWLDPLVLFSAVFGLARGGLEWRDWIAAMGLPLLIVVSCVAPGWWCRRLCPLGALQELLRVPFRARAARDTGCASGGATVGRRVFLGLGLGAGYRMAFPPLRTTTAQPPLRPPGAVDEAQFIRLCTRCGACVRSCPPRILRFGGCGAGWAGVLAPEVCFDNSSCEPSCTRCGQVCPSGAIARFTRKTKCARPMGTAVIAVEGCLLSQHRECGVCVGVCEYGALDMEWDPEEMQSRITLNPTLCTGCGCCEYICPTTPKALRVGARTS